LWVNWGKERTRVKEKTVGPERRTALLELLKKTASKTAPIQTCCRKKGTGEVPKPEAEEKSRGKKKEKNCTVGKALSELKQAPQEEKRVLAWEEG